MPALDHLMLDDANVAAIVAARHADPFSVLGMHTDARGLLVVRAMLPGAIAVDVHEAASGKQVAALAMRDADGLWEGPIGRRKLRFDYRLHVSWANGSSGIYADAYAYGPQIPEADLHYLGEGSHLRPFEVLGAHPMACSAAAPRSAEVAGVRFAVWAPNARRVSVVGSFNGWDGRRHPMRTRHGGGIWEIFVPHVGLGDLYMFELVGAGGELLPRKADPYARAAQMRPDQASVVAPLPPPRALPEGRAEANRRDAAISVYEVHLGSWRRHPDGAFHDWDELAAALPAYAADLGFTHVQLMPVTEHPFDGSWGYQTLGLYAPTARFNPRRRPTEGEDGTIERRLPPPQDPAAYEGCARFIAACHAQGLGVLADWVPAHFPTDAHGLASFDGSPLYEHADPREGYHHDWNTLIYNYGRHEVRNFLVGSALYWIERIGVDGLRVDAVASMLYRDYSRKAGEWVPNVHGGRENLEAIDFLRRANSVVGTECPGSVMVAEESTAFPGVTAPPYAGGLGFHYKWNLGWMHDTLEYMKEDPVHRRWHHEEMSFSLVYAWTENFMLPLSHDECVHGKGSILGRMPGDEWQRFANLRAYYGYMWGHPGKKLLFMGQEFAQPWEWRHDTELPWGLLAQPHHAGVQALVRDLNRCYREQPALHRLDHDPAGFEWVAVHDSDASVYAWLRRDGDGATVLVVCNFTPVPRHGFRIGVPAEVPAWREVLNTDSAYYGGSNLGNGPWPLAIDASTPAHGRSASVAVTLPPLATLYFVPAR